MSADAPLVVFVHTPKAAGSTVIKALDSIGPGLGHIERHRQDMKRFLKTAESSAWISGHLTIDAFERRLEPLDRPIRYFTAIRQPSAQVASHYNWLMEIYFKGGDFYKNHPAAARAVSQRLRNSNRSSPRVAINNMRRSPLLFLNFQSRFVLGADFAESGQEMDERLSTFEFISDGTDVYALLEAISPGLTAQGRSNVSRYHFDPQLFQTKPVKDFLAAENHLDEALYQRVRERKAAESDLNSLA